MNCTQNLSLTVENVAGCPSVPNTPTPTSLVSNNSVVIGTTSIVGGGSVHDQTSNWAASVPIGKYNIDYVGGSVQWSRLSSTDCSGGAASGLMTGNPSSGLQTNFLGSGYFISAPNIIPGYQRTNCGSTPTASASLIQSDTLLLNPLGQFTADSGSGGTGPLYQIGGVNPVGIKLQGDPSVPSDRFPSGTITWRLTQVEQVYTQVTRLRIKNYAAVKPTFSVCASSLTPDEWGVPSPSVAVEWDGTFPYGFIVYPGLDDGMVSYNASDLHNSSFFQYDFCLFSLSGKAMATTLDYETRIKYRVVSGVGFWEMAVVLYSNTYNVNLWYGTKSTGSTGEGLYSRDPSSCSTGPDTICVESY